MHQYNLASVVLHWKRLPHATNIDVNVSMIMNQLDCIACKPNTGDYKPNYNSIVKR